MRSELAEQVCWIASEFSSAPSQRIGRRDMVDGRRRNRLAKWKGARPGLALGLILCLGVAMYVSQHVMHRKAILQEERYHLEQTVVQLQDELSHMKREADALRERTQREESGARVDDSARDGGKKPKRRKQRWGTAHVTSSELLENVSAGHYDRFDRPSFVQSAYNVSWSRPAFSQRTASKALGGTITNDNGNEKKRMQVRKAMQHAWAGYRKYAYGQDELEPVTRSGVNDVSVDHGTMAPWRPLGPPLSPLSPLSSLSSSSPPLFLLSFDFDSQNPDPKLPPCLYTVRTPGSNSNRRDRHSLDHGTERRVQGGEGGGGQVQGEDAGSDSAVHL